MLLAVSWGTDATVKWDAPIENPGPAYNKSGAEGGGDVQTR